MRKISNRILSSFMRLDGYRGKGFLAALPQGNLTGKIYYRLFEAQRPTRFNSGDVLLLAGGEKILLLEHPSDHPGMKSFIVQTLETSETWQRRVVIPDLVSGFAKDNGVQAMGLLYLTFSTPTDSFLGTLKESSYKFMTGQDVKVGDIVGGKSVKQVDTILGVKSVYAE